MSAAADPVISRRAAWIIYIAFVIMMLLFALALRSAVIVTAESKSREIVCESGEQYEPTTIARREGGSLRFVLWASRCRVLGSDEEVIVTMID